MTATRRALTGVRSLATSRIASKPTASSPSAVHARSFAASTRSVGDLELSTIKKKCRKVMCIGRNYADHIKELNNQRPNQPFFFLKPPSSILLPGEGPILQPKGVRVHYEIELGLVIGRKLLNVDANDTSTWLDAIEQYILAIDLTGRNVQDEAKKKGLPWSIAKGFDTFLPISGPVLKHRIPDPHNVELWLSVNGEVKQQDNTELMLFKIGRQLADISKVMTLEKGDIILTGTPKGVGPTVPGDVIEAGIRVGGKDIDEARMKFEVKEREGPYEFRET